MTLEDLSGAVWNPVRRELWVCRNGGDGGGSKLWVLVQNPVSGIWEIGSKSGQRGEWTDFGDFEGVTQVDFLEESIYAIIEGEERIKKYDVSTYGQKTLERDWDTSPHLPENDGDGAEGITFVPDAWLAAWGFLDGAGDLYVSQRGMGGLMFVAHQNGGRLYAFDLDPDSNDFDFVGEYLTSATESSGLEFDRSNGVLYIWHDADFDTLEAVSLASVPDEGVRRLNSFCCPIRCNPLRAGSRR